MNNNPNPNNGNSNQNPESVNNQNVQTQGINNVARVIPVSTDQQVVNAPRPQNPESANIVAPTAVDLSKVQVNNDDTMINRERDNIVSATIQANAAIDKDKAKDVNNQIKVKKFSPVQITLIVVLGAVLIIAIAFGVVKLANKAMTFDDKEKTTTTTTSILQGEEAYLKRTTTIRKFQNDNYILLLSPANVDMKDNNLYYMYLKYSKDGILEEETGIYVINDNKITLTSKMNSVKEFELNQEGLVSGDIILTKFDAEMKYYQFKSEYLTKTLIVNGTLKNERALWIRSAKEGSTYQLNTVVENDTTITFGGSDVFTKKEMNIIHNNEEYQFIS